MYVGIRKNAVDIWMDKQSPIMTERSNPRSTVGVERIHRASNPRKKMLVKMNAISEDRKKSGTLKMNPIECRKDAAPKKWSAIMKDGTFKGEVANPRSNVESPTAMTRRAAST